MMAGRITIAAALLLFMCGEDEGAVALRAEPAVGELAQIAAAPTSANGGTVVAAGPLHVEVVARQDGAVEAFVLGNEPPPPDQMRITVRLTGDDGDAHPVLLTWDPSQGRYRGRLREVLPNPGPIEVVVVYAGATYRGGAPSIVLGAPVAIDGDDPEELDGPDQRGGVVVVRGGPDGPPPEPPGVDGYPDAPPPPPSVNVGIADPRPQVVVRAPGPPRVEVRPPAPPSARVVVEPPPPPTVRVQARPPAPPGPPVVVRRPGPEPVRVQVRGPGRGHGHDDDREDDHGHGRGRGGSVRVRH